MKALTGLRAVAAIGVVVSHTGVPKSLPEELAKIAQWGYIGVPMFFMLSGVVLAYNYPDLRFWEGRRTVRFYVARIARVMPLYWAMIGYCVAYYYVVGRHQYPVPLLQNIFAVQTWSGDIKVAQSYYNGPGWSIGVEMFFYLLFPFLIPYVARLYRRFGARGLVTLIAAMTLTVFALWTYFYLSGRSALPAADPGSAHRWLYRNPLCYLPIFVCGMAVAFLIPHVRAWSTRRHHLVQGLVFCYVFGLAMFRSTGPGWGTASYGLFFVAPFALVLVSLATDRGWMARFLATAPMMRLGVASYALYITHRWLVGKMPAAEFIEKGSGLVPYVSLVIVIFFLLLIAEGAHQYIEEPARRWIVKVTRRPAAPDTPRANRTVNTAADPRPLEPAGVVPQHGGGEARRA
jgi:peptidoglycan/LPS O-acetylase OafA/YrhL